jgi:myo-inositol-1-phosphate synthase
MQKTRSRRDAGRLGVWIFGALGGLATTVITGARAIARGLAGTQGLLTETELARGLALAPLDGMVFGGHEVRAGTLVESAGQIATATGALPLPLLAALRGDLARISRAIRPGTLCNAGPTIHALARKQARALPPLRSLRAEVTRLQADLRAFLRRNRLQRCVCVNLASTEPPLPAHAAHAGREAFERALDRDLRSAVRPSALYSYAAASLGLPYVHFTPSDAALLPAIQETFRQNGAPFMGSDGKTGETLVKSALAPLFKYRNLRVLTWQGYNMLGDRDGVVLATAANKQAKIATKDALLSRILGYPLHTHVGIDYVPSLDDLKTAWDFIHFQGFLGFKMSLQFTWQGCDAILAAPLVLDLVRFAELAQRRGESGSMPHLACFFKKPLGVDEHDLHAQWQLLADYAARARVR